MVNMEGLTGWRQASDSRRPSVYRYEVRGEVAALGRYDRPGHWLTLDELLGPSGRQYIPYLCVKWQVSEETFRAGDALPQRPLDLEQFAWALGITTEHAAALDLEMIEAFEPAAKADPRAEFAAVPIAQAQEWWEGEY